MSTKDSKENSQDEEERELPLLSAEQQEYVLLRASGKNIYNSYLESHKPNSTNRNSIQVAAVRLENLDKIQLWLRASKREGLTKAGLTVDEYLRQLSADMELMRENKQLGALASCHKILGSTINAFAEHQEAGARQKDTKLLDKLERLLGKEASIIAAKRLGMQVEEEHTLQ